MWYSPQWTFMHGTITSQQTHIAHVVQPAVNSHVWDNNGTDAHTAHVVQSAVNSHAWDNYVTDIQPMWYYVYNINLNHHRQIILKHCAS